MSNNILVRADGSSVIGLGHITRCVALAAMLEKQFVIEFYLYNSDVKVKSFLEQYDFKAEMVLDEQAFFDKIKPNDIVVLDGYQFDKIYQMKIKELNAILICIDDLHDKHFVADVIINHAPGVAKESYKAEKYTKFLLGAEFALLRPLFLEQAALSHKVDTSITRALICFGGADLNNLTISTLEILLDDSRFTEIVVVTGSAYNYFNEITEIVSKSENVAHFHNVNELQIIDLLRSVQIAIVPASGILFEVVACKIPVISGYYVNNQMDIYYGFRSLGVFYDAGNFGMLQIKEAIGKAFQGDNKEMLERQASCIDGKSGERYLDFFCRLSYENSDSCR